MEQSPSGQSALPGPDELDSSAALVVAEVALDVPVEDSGDVGADVDVEVAVVLVLPSIAETSSPHPVSMRRKTQTAEAGTTTRLMALVLSSDHGDNASRTPRKSGERSTQVQRVDPFQRRARRPWVVGPKCCRGEPRDSTSGTTHRPAVAPPGLVCCSFSGPRRPRRPPVHKRGHTGSEAMPVVRVEDPPEPRVARRRRLRPDLAQAERTQRRGRVSSMSSSCSSRIVSPSARSNPSWTRGGLARPPRSWQ